MTVYNPPIGAVSSVSNVDGSLTIAPTTGDVIASLNTAHSNTWTASQTFLDDTIFSEPDPITSNTLKLIYYSKLDNLYSESWTLGYNNSLPTPDLSQIIVGNNNTMASFVGAVFGYGNNVTNSEDVFMSGINNTADSTSAGFVYGISNSLGSGSLQFAIGHTNILGNFNNLVSVGLGNGNSADSTVTLGIGLSNSTANTLDIGVSNTTKLTLGTTYARFRTDVGIGTTPSAGLHVLKTTEQLRLSYDASNSVQFIVSSGGNLSLQTTAGATAGVYTLTPHGAGGVGTNRTLDFGRAWGNAAIFLYNNGSASRFGWGMKADQMQFFAPTTTGGTFTWNKGGDLQASGTNELMRLYQYASGTAGLSIGGAGGGLSPTSPYKIELDGESLAGGTAGTQDIIRFRRGQTGGVSYPEAFSIGLGRYSSSGTGPDTRVDFNLKSTAATNFTTDVGVMSLNSNGRVLIGTVGAASATLHLIATTEQFRSGYDASNYWNATTSSAGAVTFNAVGASASFAFSDVIRATDGSASTPAYSFTTSTNTGIYLGASNVLYIAQAGNDIMRFSNSAMLAYKNITGLDTKTFNLNAAAGSATIPSYSFNTDANTGMWSSGADTLNFATGGTDRLTLTTTEVTFADSFNIAFNTTTGTKIGTATSQKLSFWNATPIVQPTTSVGSATLTSPGAGTNLKSDDTFDGYTLQQVVKALRNAGLLA